MGVDTEMQDSEPILAHLTQAAEKQAQECWFKSWIVDFDGKTQGKQIKSGRGNHLCL